ncbi:3-oxo-tetronate 4-phosphate decarboxylase [Roseiconus lacunae]|uniref:3-oxo-tetronate 4-phosphate decarboxylase n=1 Tax=Roseiconus lacunae TaxID=2605694 RepID=A0ABT7PGC0_9BACT|nr:3-oxo-tetronate 4-phosphate decarboxylase [Roseiconus lacunae]MCD0460437.1 aldolase [Roseiconus lacunae]MDM4015516.1 aldolase [Roseiconus lacunae]WRQ52807.1 3-oxo-tetronate 4-phosphate decarboxylase [Stieleria sp. HD01]
MSERELREQMAMHGKSMFDRGLTMGSSGNLSVKLPDGYLVTPTNCCLGRLDPEAISRLDSVGNLISGKPPSKEAFLHLAYYGAREQERAVVHLHSTYSVALSCRADLDTDNVLPPVTAYFVMRVGRLPLVPYFAPGDDQLAEAVAKTVRTSRGALLANHGPVIGGRDLDNAVYSIEELEETAKLYWMLQGTSTRFLTSEQVHQLNERFPQ